MLASAVRVLGRLLTTSETGGVLTFEDIVSSVAYSELIRKRIVELSLQFNFSMAIRPVRFQVAIAALDMNNFESRYMSYAKQLWQFGERQSLDANLLIFASSRKHARRLAADLVAMAKMHNKSLHNFVADACAVDCLTKSMLTQLKSPDARFLVVRGGLVPKAVLLFKVGEEKYFAWSARRP